MSEMIDRVAMALCVGSGRNPHEKIEGDVHTFGDHPIDFNAATVDMIIWDFRWKIFRRHARLAIEAMREPSSEMELAWIAASAEHADRYLNIERYQAMIDEALKA